VKCANRKNLLGFWAFPSSVILENTTFRKLDMFPFLGEVWEKAPTQLGPLEKADLSHSLRGTTE
jgi:hypothetical protein